MTRWRHAPLIAALSFWAGSTRAQTNLADAYAALGFDPLASGNAVVVVFSDPHIALCYSVATNLDARLVNTVNAMNPAPARILCTGDVTDTYSEIPGFSYGPWVVSWATNEMRCWLSAIQAFTNVAQTNILWVPGNHDQDFYETNAEVFCRMFPNMPPYQSFDLAGVRFLLLNGGNANEPSDTERLWLKQQVLGTAATQTIVALVHQPPFSGIAAERGGGLMIRDCFRFWNAPWWLIQGHAHCFGEGVFDVGRSNVATTSVGTVNPQQFNGQNFNAGFLILCLSNGIAGRIYYHFPDGRFEVMGPPDWQHPAHYSPAFEEVPGVLLKRFKTPGFRAPELTFASAYRDCGYWWLYPRQLEWALSLRWYNNQATHFLLATPGINGDAKVLFSVDRTNWIEVPLPVPTNQMYSFPIPPDIARLPTAFVRFSATQGENWVGGYGLATTNQTPQPPMLQLAPVPDQQVGSGQMLMVPIVANDPYALPDALAFTILSGPLGATINQRTGVFAWRPQLGFRTNLLAVSVTIGLTDSGPPLMSATQQFNITVTNAVGILPEVPVAKSGPLHELAWSQQGFSFKVTLASNLNYTVWASENLVDWTAMWWTNPPADTFDVLDPVAGNLPRRYYKVSTQR